MNAGAARIRGEMKILRRRMEDVDAYDRLALFDAEMDRICPEDGPTPACGWTQPGDNFEAYDFWETECGKAFCFNEGGPSDNGMKFCCYCGKHLVEEPWTEPEDEEEIENVHD